MQAQSRSSYDKQLFERIRVLGRGSFGTAVVCRRRADCALVVLKEIELPRARDCQLAAREARIMAALSHPNIIQYYAAYTTDTKLIIEMEYARMGTLQTYLAQRAEEEASPLLTEAEALAILRQLLAGLTYLHARNIAHLDLKMANIFISAEATIKLGDFGIAQFIRPNPMGDERRGADGVVSGKQASMTSASGHQLGTLAYSSPERCLGLASDCSSDIWSLGCILYELLTLRLLFPSESLAELVMSITHIRYQPLVEVRADISLATCKLFEQMIARQPNERPGAAKLELLVDRALAQLSTAPQQTKQSQKQRRLADFSSFEAPMFGGRIAATTAAVALNRPHSLVYKVQLNGRHVRVHRLRLPQSKRIKQIVKGRSHYLALTYDHIVYGWGSRACGQLGAGRQLSARNSFTATSSGGWRAPVSLASSSQTIGTEASKNQHLMEPNMGETTAKPFILNELNKRKIERVAAGNDFSVFLSKTGILMTCGDGSSGCLGRGELTARDTWQQAPCMVDSLLGLDVIDVACGPEHVVAICADGQAFAWGRAANGRLGVSPALLAGRQFVQQPQQVDFLQAEKGERVRIVAAFCGDTSTMFLDSNQTCWACGENISNRLGLDQRRHFKRTLVVARAWTPHRVQGLERQRVLAATIGRRHSVLLTVEGKLLVLGQDVDQAARLRPKLLADGQHRHLLAELQPRATNLHNSNLTINLERLSAALLASNQLASFKAASPEGATSGVKKPKTSRFQRRQVDAYLRRARALKRMSLDCVLSASATAKFTLALTADNRVYFWGTRSHLDESEPSAHNRLLAVGEDECFVKIGPTNSTLMSNIELLGSDQPILQARDPQLTARSLADLWILDYWPDNDDELCSSSSCHSSTCSLCSDEACQSATNGGMRHEAILEPQPIVSLYVPSMFNQNNNRALKLVNLFCHHQDEDSFFLVLDTTVTQQQQVASPSAPTSKCSSRRGSQAALKLVAERNTPLAATQLPLLKLAEERKSSFSSTTPSSASSPVLSRSSSSSVLTATRCRDNSIEIFDLETDSSSVSSGAASDAIFKSANDCASSQTLRGAGELEATESQGTQRSPTSNNGLSLEEPRSMSTFLGQASLMARASVDGEAPTMRRLEFDSVAGDIGEMESRKRSRRRHRSLVNLSESTGATADDFDETSCMPTWVRNEYFQAPAQEGQLDEDEDESQVNPQMDSSQPGIAQLQTSRGASSDEFHERRKSSCSSSVAPSSRLSRSQPNLATGSGLLCANLAHCRVYQACDMRQASSICASSSSSSPPARQNVALAPGQLETNSQQTRATGVGTVVSQVMAASTSERLSSSCVELCADTSGELVTMIESTRRAAAIEGGDERSQARAPPLSPTTTKTRMMRQRHLMAQSQTLLSSRLMSTAGGGGGSLVSLRRSLAKLFC